MTSGKEEYVQVHEDLPAFIVGLPEDLLEADVAKIFDKMSESLKKQFAQEELNTKQKGSIRQSDHRDMTS